MFSDRTQWDQRPNQLAAAWALRLSSGLPAVDLTESNPTRCGFRYPEEEILRSLSDPRALRYQPDPKGLLAAREAIARDRVEHADPVDPEHLILTASTSEAYSWLFKLLCNPGDRILTPQPSYPLFDYLAGLEEIAVDRYPLRYERGWAIDFEELENAIGPWTRAIVVVHPNNPTGNLVTTDEALRLGQICAARNIALISDEVFSDYPFRPGTSAALAAHLPCLTFSLGGLSKSTGLPQIKVGWIRTGGPSRLADQALSRLEVIADTYLSVNTPAQWAIPGLLRAGAGVRDQIQARTRANRGWCQQRQTGESSWELLQADGGWSGVIRVPGTSSEEDWCLGLIEEEGVLTHPGYFFDFASEAFLVVSFLPEEETFRAGMMRVLQRMP